MSNPSALENERVDALIGQPRPPLTAAITAPRDLDALREAWTRAEPVPVLLQGPENGDDQSWGGLDVRALLRGEQSGGRYCAHSIVLAPGAGLRPHFFEDVQTFLIVVKGVVEITVGSTTRAAGPCGLAYVPHRTHQAFRNTSGDRATLLAIHSPGGVDAAFAAAHARWKRSGEEDMEAYEDLLALYGFNFGAAPLPSDSRTNASAPSLDFEIKGPGDLARLRQAFEARQAIPKLILTPESEIRSVDAGQVFRKELLNGDDSGGAAMFNLLSGPPGFGAPAHHQPTEEEFFFVIDGRLEVTCGLETQATGHGAFAFCPRNATHAFRNLSDTDYVRFITLNSPAGHERAMAAVRAAAQGGASKQDLHALSEIGGFIFH